MTSAARKNLISLSGTVIAIALGYGLSEVLGASSKTTIGDLSLTSVCILAAFIVQWLMFIPAFVFKTERYFDLTGSLTYISLVIVALVLGLADARSLLLGAMVLLWAVRLGSCLFARVSQAGEDRRFRKMQHHFLEFLMTWTLQGL